MPHSQKRPARANGSGLSHNIPMQLASYGNDDTAALALRQEPIDIVDLLAARSGVHPATVAAHLVAFGFGGGHV